MCTCSTGARVPLGHVFNKRMCSIWGTCSTGARVRLGHVFHWGTCSTGARVSLRHLFHWGTCSTGACVPFWAPVPLGHVFFWSAFSAGALLYSRILCSNAALGAREPPFASRGRLFQRSASFREGPVQWKRLFQGGACSTEVFLCLDNRPAAGQCTTQSSSTGFYSRISPVFTFLLFH